MLASSISSEVRRRLLAPLLLALLLQPVAALAAIDLLGYTLAPLDRDTAATPDAYRGKPTVLVVFEPDCVYCARQVRVMNALLRDCPDLQALAVGVHGNRARLRQYAESMRPEFPAYAASPAFERDLGSIEITPILLVADARGEYVFHMFGLQDREHLLTQLGVLAGSCAK